MRHRRVCWLVRHSRCYLAPLTARSECPTTVVNTVVVDEADCLYHGQGLIGFNSGADGQNRCACSTATNDVSFHPPRSSTSFKDRADHHSQSGEADNFTTCPSPANGRGTCVSVDPDFLGQSLDHREVIKCGVLCDEVRPPSAGPDSQLMKIFRITS